MATGLIRSMMFVRIAVIHLSYLIIQMTTDCLEIRVTIPKGNWRQI